MNENKDGYISMPTRIFYDPKICAAAKILYAEITALSNQKGYCWASNQYFADIHKVDVKTVKRWVKALIDKKYLKSAINASDENGTNIKRCLVLTNALQGDKFIPKSKSFVPDLPIEEPVEDDLTMQEGDNIVPDDFSLLQADQYLSEKAAFFYPKKDKNVYFEGAKMSDEGDNIVSSNNIINNLKDPSVRYNSGDDEQADKKLFLVDCIKIRIKQLPEEDRRQIEPILLALFDRLMTYNFLKINQVNRSVTEILSAILDLFRDDATAVVECISRVRGFRRKSKFLYLITSLFNEAKEL